MFKVRNGLDTVRINEVAGKQNTRSLVNENVVLELNKKANK